MSVKLIIMQSNLTLKGGAERVILKIAKHYNAKVYTAEYEQQNTFNEFKDIDIEVIGSKFLLNLLPYGRINQAINYGSAFYNFKLKEDYDVINAHMAPSHWIRNKNINVLWYCHTPLRDVYDLYKYRLSLKKYYQKPLYSLGRNVIKHIDKNIVNKIEFIFANSRNTEMRIKKFYNRNDAEVLNGGIDYKLYENNGDKKYFLYPSRISQNKRQDYAIRAFEIFKRKLRLNDKNKYKLIICGALSKDKSFRNYYNEIKHQIKKIENAELLLNIDEKKLHNLYSNATAVLYPPLNEDYGLVPLEAMASGKPIIAVNEGGPKETIVNNKTGFLINNENEMAERMKYVAEHPAIAKEIGKNGMQRIKKYYSWDIFFEKFDKKINEMKKNGK